MLRVGSEPSVSRNSRLLGLHLAAIDDHLLLSAHQLAMAALPANCFVLKRTNQLESLLTIIRDVETKRSEFVFYSDRIIRLLVEEVRLLSL